MFCKLWVGRACISKFTQLMELSELQTWDHKQILASVVQCLGRNRLSKSPDRPTLVAMNRKEQIANATRKASKHRMLAEIKRPKYLFDDFNTSRPKPPSYHIKQAYIKHQGSPTSRNSPSSQLDAAVSFVMSSEIDTSVSPRHEPKPIGNILEPIDTPTLRKKEPLTRTSQEFMQDFYPNWLKSRQEFIEVYRNMREKACRNVSEICKKVAFQRSDEEREAVTHWLEHLECFRDLPRDTLKELSGRFTTAVFEAGTALMRQGEPGDCMFVLYRGNVDVLIDGVGKVGEIQGKSVVGEAAIRNGVDRTATIVATTKVIALKLKKQDYTDVLMTLKISEKLKFTQFLQSVEFFRSWSPVKIQQFSSFLMSYNYTQGQTIYNLGDPSPTFYIIMSGKVQLQTQVDVSQHHRWPVGDREWELMNLMHKFRVTVKTVNQCEFFGQAEVINDIPRQTSAIAGEDTQCLIINRKELFEVLMASDIEKILNFDPLLIPANEILEREVLQRLHKKKLFNRALIDAVDVDFEPSKRGVMTNKRSVKMQYWVDGMKERIREENEQLKSEIIQSKRKTIRITN